MNENWLEIANLNDLIINEGKAIRVNNLSIALFRLPDDQVYAIENSCPHIGAPLDSGIVENKTITCLWHSWCFSLIDGYSTNCPNVKVQTYPTKVEKDKVFLQI